MTITRLLPSILLALAAACGTAAPDGGAGPDSGPTGGYSDAGSWGASDAGAGGGGNIGLGGAGDFGYFRRLLEANQVPRPDDFDAAGFFHEHYLSLPPPSCGERVCLQAMLGVMPGVIDAEPFSTLHLGLNTPVSIDPNDRPPLTLAVVVDVSGSMASEDKIGFVRSGLRTLIDNLEDDDRLAIITYNDSSSLAAPMNPVGGRRAQLRQIADGLTAGGGTNLHAGLERGYDQVLAQYDLARQNRVIMLSDGMPTTGVTDESAILDMSAGYNSDGLGVTTIGLGTSFNASLMRGLAEQGNGNHYFLESSSAIDEVFVEELAFFAVPVAFDVSLQVTEGSHYQFAAAYGSSFWTDSADGGSLEVPSVFLAHRVSADDVHDPDAGTPGRRGGGSALLLRLTPRSPTPDPEDNQAVVAIVDVSFREPGGTDIVTDRVVVNHPYWLEPPATGHIDSPDPASTQKVLVMLELYRAIERACEAFHDGRGTEGLTALLRADAAAADYNGEVEDLDIELDRQLVQRLMEVMEANGAVPPTDPAIPNDPWPAD